MAALFQRLFRRNPAQLPCIGAGQRIYAIGDVHGRLDLLTALCDTIDDDDRQLAPLDTTVIFLGDLIDRGPDSAETLRFTREWREKRHVRFIMGNHEEMLLLSLEQPEALGGFLRFGGRETLASYGLDTDEFTNTPYEKIQAQLVEIVPPKDRAFIRNFESSITVGDYLFVHAGVRPNIPIEEQEMQDLRWIREPFLSFRGDHGLHVVHGHTISDEVELKTNRTGIDTGAYRTGKLTALCLEGTDKRILQTEQDDSGIRVIERITEEA